MKTNRIFSLLSALAALIGIPDGGKSAEPLLAALEDALWRDFSTPLPRADLAAVGYALSRLCIASDRLLARGGALGEAPREAEAALRRLIHDLPTLCQPGKIPDGGEFRRILHRRVPEREREFLRIAEEAWEACIRAALSGI